MMAFPISQAIPLCQALGLAALGRYDHYPTLLLLFIQQYSWSASPVPETVIGAGEAGVPALRKTKV